MAYSIKPTEPYLTEKGIATIKSNLAQEIFRQDLYQKQTDLRDELRQESRDRITEIVDAIVAELTGVCKFGFVIDRKAWGELHIASGFAVRF